MARVLRLWPAVFAIGGALLVIATWQHRISAPILAPFLLMCALLEAIRRAMA
jgi:hypothetical protein